MKTYFAVTPDGHSQPVALFQQLEDAIEWGMGHIGADKFSIRGVVGAATRWAEGEVPSEVVQGN
ncbi:MAG: hypothetical protein KA712_14715 [Myxococcales bacterium]|nr:hypothetical protein [Myxococcales bacterium]